MKTSVAYARPIPQTKGNIEGLDRQWRDLEAERHARLLAKRLLTPPRTAGVEEVRRAADGGKVTVAEDAITVENANSAMLVLAGATSFVNYRDISGDPAARCQATLDAVKGKSFDALLKAHVGTKPPTHRLSPDDDALFLMSGGTTGTPKAVRVHHGGLIRTGMQVRAWLGGVLPEWEGAYCLPLPMFHSYGACGVQSVCFIGHNPIALVPNPRDLNALVKTIERTRPAVFCAVPTLYNALLNHKRVASGKVDFRSMKACVSGAAPMMAETHKRFTEVTGARVIEGYALTESLLAATIWPLEGPTKVGSVGVPLPDCRVRIVDADDPTKELPAGEVGEVLLTGPQIMRGYFNAPEGTDPMLATHADGSRWLHTADLGYVDADGWLFIVDRKKDLIKMNGMQVWPREIEEVLSSHPAVAEPGVRGFPDAARGEVAVAFVVRRVGQAVTATDLRAWCKERLAPFKVPARVVFKEELPKSMVGKVLRRFLTEEGATVA